MPARSKRKGPDPTKDKDYPRTYTRSIDDTIANQPMAVRGSWENAYHSSQGLPRKSRRMFPARFQSHQYFFPMSPPVPQFSTIRSHSDPTMNSMKRSFDEVSGYSPFQFPRNVRARLSTRHQGMPVTTPRSHFRSILRDQRLGTNDCKENVAQDSNCYSSDRPLSETSSPQGRRIRFYQKVAVHSIPARHYYTDDIKRRMWCNMAELREMARRNTIEFAAEGYDWRRATEDDAMLLTPSGERIHPVWQQHRDFQPLQSKIRKMRSTGEAKGV